MTETFTKNEESYNRISQLLDTYERMRLDPTTAEAVRSMVGQDTKIIKIMANFLGHSHIFATLRRSPTRE